MISLDIEVEKARIDEWSEIFDYREDLEKLQRALNKSGSFERVVVVGNGGSITSYDAYFWALSLQNNSKTVWTMDPSLLSWTAKEFPNDGKTVVVAVSKSGNTLGQIESLLYFKEYPVIVVTDPENGTLSQIAKVLGWTMVVHPPVGGRFSGGTSSAFVPSCLAGIGVDKIQQGIVNGYEQRDLAYSLANFYFEKEKEGFDEVYVNCYSEQLAGFGNLIIQLMHESVCKDGKGQTFYFAMGPESQHHTNQRFIGGKKNVIGTFIVAEKNESDQKQVVPENIKDIDYKSSKLSFLSNVTYQEALHAEYQGTKEDADKNDVPNVTIALDRVSEESVGRLVAFWHLVAFYSAILRGVNPFDQPAVENSKNITLDILKK